MAGLGSALLMGLAGGVKGYGEHAVRVGLQKREMKMKLLDQQFQLQRDEAARAHDRSEGALDRASRESLATGKSTEAQRKIAALRARGKTQQEAEDIAFGLNRVVTHPVSGETTLVNIADATQRELTPADGSQAAEPGRTGGARSIFNGQPLEEQSSSETEARGRTETTPARQQAQTLYSMADDATGALPAIKEIYTNIAGQLPDFMPEWDPDTVDQRQQYAVAQQALIRALAINPRFPVGEMERIRQEIDIGPSVFKSPESLRQKMQAVDKGLRVRLENERRIADDRRMPIEQKRAARAAIANIENFLSILGVPQGEEQEEGASQASSDSAAPEGFPDPELWQFMTPDEQRRWQDLSRN